MEREEHQADELIRAYDAHADAIFRHCYYRLFNRERARELMQEAFMNTWEYIKNGHEIENMRAFLYRTANNLVVNEFHKRKTDSLDELQEKGFDVGENPKTALEAKVEAQMLGQNVFSKMNPAYRDAVIMRYIDDLKPEEIASLTGETPNTVSAHISRGIKQIKTILEKLGKEEKSI